MRRDGTILSDSRYSLSLSLELAKQTKEIVAFRCCYLTSFVSDFGFRNSLVVM